MATTTLMSFAEFELLDEDGSDLELLKGELIRMPYPERPNMITCQRLFQGLDSAVERLRQEAPGIELGMVHIEMGYRLTGEPGSGLRPDVSLTHPNQPGDRFYIGAPLIAFEVVSPNEKADHLNEKVQEYLAYGAAEVWLIYPKLRNAWVYDGSGAARNETRSFHTHLLPGIDIPFSEIL